MILTKKRTVADFSVDSIIFLVVFFNSMPGTVRIVIPEVPHQITQWGNNRQDVLFVDNDRRVYLFILKQQSQKYRLEIIGWCCRQRSRRHSGYLGSPI